MEFITKNLKTVGIVNTILIVVALVARCITFADSPAMIKAESIIGAIGLISGLIYAFNGYKKDAAKYYKLFMYTYVVISIISLIVEIVASKTMGVRALQFSFVIIPFICICLLAFVKDFGKTKSITAIGIVLLINVIRFARAIIKNTDLNISTVSLGNLVLAIIAFIFVVCKYADKEARGTK